MEKFEISLIQASELVEMGNGELDKGLEEISKKGWKIIDDFVDPHTGEKYKDKIRRITDDYPYQNEKGDLI